MAEAELPVSDLRVTHHILTVTLFGPSTPKIDKSGSLLLFFGCTMQ